MAPLGNAVVLVAKRQPRRARWLNSDKASAQALFRRTSRAVCCCERSNRIEETKTTTEFCFSARAIFSRRLKIAKPSENATIHFWQQPTACAKNCFWHQKCVQLAKSADVFDFSFRTSRISKGRARIRRWFDRDYIWLEESYQVWYFFCEPTSIESTISHLLHPVASLNSEIAQFDQILKPNPPNHNSFVISPD